MESVGSATTVWTRETAIGEKRDLWSAMKRGFRGRCPRCGQGKLFRAFLKVDDHCSACGQDFTAHRADDLPAYLVIVIVGHIVVPAVLWIEHLRQALNSVRSLNWGIRPRVRLEKTCHDESTTARLPSTADMPAYGQHRRLVRTNDVLRSCS